MSLDIKNFEHNIPNLWNIISFKKVFKEVYRYPTYFNIEYVSEGVREIRGEALSKDGDMINLENFRYISKETSSRFPRTVLELNDLVISVRGTMGKVGLVTEGFVGSNMTANLLRLSPSVKFSGHFLKYFLTSEYFNKSLDSLSPVTTIKTITIPQLSKIKIIQPPLEEQKKIAEFLDKQTSKIDSIIKTKEQQLINLEELKKSIIHKAVTKGLDNSVEMMDSKIEWIGDIPKHWDTQMLKRTTSIKGRIGWQGLTSDEYQTEGKHLLVTGTDFKGRYLNWETCHYIEKERYDEDRKIQLKEKDILVTKDGTIGKIAMVKDMILPTTLNSGVFVTRPIKNEYIQEYMYWVLFSDMLMEFIQYSKVGSTIAHLYQKTFEKFVYPLPPKDEQEKIVKYLDIEVEKINSLKVNVSQQIEKLKEYKKSLIYEYVTGKKQVKE